MGRDEEEIRRLVEEWMEATRAGDVERVLGMMTEDVVFLVAGREPMGKAEFAAGSRAMAGTGSPTIDGKSAIQEVQVAGEWAFMWTKLSVTVTPPGGAEPMHRRGHTLTVFRKLNGKWLLARDANLLVPVTKREGNIP